MAGYETWFTGAILIEIGVFGLIFVCMMILYNVDLSTENSNIEEVERAS